LIAAPIGQSWRVRIADRVRLYDGPAPGSESWNHVERRYWSDLWDTEVVANVVEPTVTPVFPDGEPTGAAVVIAPGGDDPIADLVAEMMKGGTGVFDDMAAVAPLAAADGRAAVRLVRERADEFGVDPNRVGVMGFSAGGNVAVQVAYADDPAARPSFVAAVYPSTRGFELGEPPAGSGPMFLALASDDELGLAGDSIALYETWRRARLPVELHAYATGGHGFGMRTKHLLSDSWIDRFLDWSAVMV